MCIHDAKIERSVNTLALQVKISNYALDQRGRNKE